LDRRLGGPQSWPVHGGIKKNSQPLSGLKPPTIQLLIPRKQKCFHAKIYRLCNMTGYTNNMKIYSRKGRQSATKMMRTKYVTLRSLTRKVEEVGHKPYMDFPLLLSYLMTCTQQVSTVAILSDKIIKECQGAMTNGMTYMIG
jgi:hypothetical protein